MIGGTSDIPLPATYTMNTAEATPLDDEITIMSANVHGWETLQKKPGFSTFMATLLRESPDIVFVNEMIDDPAKIQAIADAGYSNVYAQTKTQGIRESTGNAVLSKAPLRLERVVWLQNSHTTEPRNAMIVGVQTTKGWVWVANTHLSINTDEARRQLRQLDDEIHSGEPVAIFGGDLNYEQPISEPRTIGKSAVRSGRLLDFQAAVDQPPTFPHGLEIFRLDHILSSCFLPEDPYTVDIGSDHKGLMVHGDISKCAN